MEGATLFEENVALFCICYVLYCAAGLKLGIRISHAEHLVFYF